MKDLRDAVRMLLKHHMATVFAVLALGIGIGASSTNFTRANSVLLSLAPFLNPHRIMRIGEQRVDHGVENLSLSGLNSLEWKNRCRSFSAACLLTVRYFNLTGNSGTRRVYPSGGPAARPSRPLSLPFPANGTGASHARTGTEPIRCRIR